MDRVSTLRQSGQALVYALALMVPLILAGAYVFNSFQLSNEKTRLQNTTDAVAYSVATVEARDLNFKAYTNRAMVANQVAIAQAVGLVSWSRWLSTTSENIALVTSWVPYLNSVTQALKNVSAVFNDAVELVMPAFALSIDATIELIKGSQDIYHFHTVLAAAETLREVASANDPDVDTAITVSNAAMLAKYTSDHLTFSKKFSPDTVRDSRSRNETYYEHFNRMEEMREITMESRDGFSSRRNYDWFTLDLFVFQIEIRKAGGTDLSGEDSRYRYGSWVAMDTMSFHERSRGCGFFGNKWCGWKETIPIGWGAAKNARSEENVRFSARHHRGRGDLGDSWRDNPAASTFAAAVNQSKQEVEQSGIDYRGLREYYDLLHDGYIEKAPGIRILLTKPQTAFRSDRAIGFNSDNLNIGESAAMVSNRMSAMAEAVPYFARISDTVSVDSSFLRSGNQREYGNLYNPYWQAKLSSMTEEEKRLTQLAAGLF